MINCKTEIRYFGKHVIKEDKVYKNPVIYTATKISENIFLVNTKISHFIN